MPGEIFISYRRSDEARAKLLHDLLKERGVEAWYDRLVPAGEDWRSATANALVKAPVFVLLFSKNAAQSDDIVKELSAATFQKKTVIPVRIEDIHPEGAFLYELASRNWFDAFANTEARFAVLADQLAALVKGGAEAQAAASKLGATAPLAPVKSRKLNLVVMSGIALGALAIVAAALVALNPPKKPAAVENERAAFFGFAAADAGALTTQVASVATEETYSTLTALGVETAARGDTEGVALKDQLARARELQARYALGGEVRTSGDQITVTVRLDDAQTRATLWQTTLAGGAKWSESLPVQAAAKATYVVQCLIAVRPAMARESAGALGLVTRACEVTDERNPEGLTRWREVLGVAPKSTFALVQAARRWRILSATANEADRQTMLEEARKGYDQALAIDDSYAAARTGRAASDIASDRPLAEILEVMNAALGAGVDRSDRRSIGDAAALRISLLNTVGRGAEAVRLARADVRADPLNVLLQSGYGTALAVAGQFEQAYRVYDSVNRRLADPANWSRLARATVGSGGDLGPVVAAAPPGVPPETIACWQDVANTMRASDEVARKAGAQRVLACMRRDDISSGVALGSVVSLGDVDVAFDAFGPMLDRCNPVVFGLMGSTLFGQQTKALRADPRFLPLVKKVGIYQYWLDTGTQPDVCETPEERDIEVCRELRREQGR